jgi:hypothetical protein
MRSFTPFLFVVVDGSDFTGHNRKQLVPFYFPTEITRSRQPKTYAADIFTRQSLDLAIKPRFSWNARHFVANDQWDNGHGYNQTMPRYLHYRPEDDVTYTESSHAGDIPPDSRAEESSSCCNT